MAVHRAPQVTGRGRKLLLIVVPPVVLLAGAAMLFIAQPEEPVIPLDADLCPLDDAASPSAVLLLDLRKPLGDEAASLAAGALRDVTLQLARHTELRVFALTSNAGAPRLPVRRFCKPYANDDISVGSAKDGPATRDCDDLPAQLTAQTAENATRFCALRDQVGAEIQRLVERPLAIPVPNAYLVEAIEETSLAFAERTGARSLYVFSDMLQHAGWFSHAERGSQGWGFNDFIHMREVEEASVGPRPPPLDGVDATVYYIPRTGVTDAPRAKMNHMAFWRQYFTDSLGTAPTFEELATLPDYPVEPLLNTLTEAEKLAQERKRLEAQSKRLERATAEYEAAQQRDIGLDQLAIVAPKPRGRRRRRKRRGRRRRRRKKRSGRRKRRKRRDGPRKTPRATNLPRPRKRGRRTSRKRKSRRRRRKRRNKRRKNPRKNPCNLPRRPNRRRKWRSSRRRPSRWRPAMRPTRHRAQWRPSQSPPRRKPRRPRCRAWRRTLRPRRTKRNALSARPPCRSGSKTPTPIR